VRSRQTRLHRFQFEDRTHRIRPKFSLDDGIRELIKGYRMIRDRVYGNNLTIMFEGTQLTDQSEKRCVGMSDPAYGAGRFVIRRILCP